MLLQMGTFAKHMHHCIASHHLFFFSSFFSSASSHAAPTKGDSVSVSNVFGAHFSNIKIKVKERERDINASVSYAREEWIYAMENRKFKRFFLSSSQLQLQLLHVYFFYMLSRTLFSNTKNALK